MAADPLGIQVRSGLHTGEIEIAADEVRGIAVHIASRVAALAGPAEVLVSRTVKDLVAGSGLHFDELPGSQGQRRRAEPRRIFEPSLNWQAPPAGARRSVWVEILGLCDQTGLAKLGDVGRHGRYGWHGLLIS